jgi:hypothetical protein
MSPQSPVFPDSHRDGIDLRTYIAARAMAAYIGNEPWLKEANEVSHNNPILLAGTVASVACMQADALIKQLNKEAK